MGESLTLEGRGKVPSWLAEEEGSGLALCSTPGTQTCSAFPSKPTPAHHVARARLSTGASHGFSWQELWSRSGSPNQCIFSVPHTTCPCSCRICWLKLSEGSVHHLPGCLQPGTHHPHCSGLCASALEVAPAHSHTAQFLLPALLLVSAHCYSSQQRRARNRGP